jgi:cobalt-precorrin-5B (C1)-methyltransferase
MILILGGTTEGRLAVKVADEAGSPYYYSTRGIQQEIACRNGIHLTGGMDVEAMTSFCIHHQIRLLVDAAHPFAVGLHQTVHETAIRLNLPVVRVERSYPERATDIVWCEDYEDAVRQLEKDRIHSLLSLTGVQTIGKLRGYWAKHPCWFRILKRDESLALARSQGFDEQRIVYYQAEDEESLLKRLTPQAILTKESGETGGFQQKIDAARMLGIPVYVVKRPSLPDSFMNVTGEYGLRKQIEKWVPGFYPLRSGYTTGACATAASKAALLGLLGRDIPSLIPIRFPNGETLSLPVVDVQWGEESVSAIVVKDAGDDPDVTHGHRIVSTIRFSSHPGIHFLQGEGVGKVTLPGLGLEIGEPAINKVPRQMMEQELSALYQGGLDVTISVPDGRELAKRTFNPKLGIVDGISIIGTSGIVRPFSSEAFVEAIRREIEVAQALGCTHLVINSGAKSERYLKIEFPDLLPQAFVHFGNFIGETLRIADELHIPEVTMGIMIGKAVKLAEGFLDTHSKKVVMNKAFLKQLAIKSGCSQEALALIENLTLARELWEHLSEADASLFFTELLDNCYAHCRPLMSDGKLTILLIDEEGHIFNWKER